jgi:hypothetical protein
MSIPVEQKNSWKLFFIAVGGTIVTLLGHTLADDPMLQHIDGFTQSIVIRAGLFKPVAFICLVLTYMVMGFIFLRIHKGLRGTNHRKGLSYGVSLGGLWFFAMVETHPMFNVSLIGEFFIGLISLFAILLMSILLATYAADMIPAPKKPMRIWFPATIIIPICYLLLRYFSYTVIHIESGYSARPMATFLWTAGMGIWIGVMYHLLEMETLRSQPLKQALVFGGLVVGINWIISNLFFLLLLDYSILDVLYRSGVDTLAIIAGAYLSSLMYTFFHKKPERCLKNG